MGGLACASDFAQRYGPQPDQEAFSFATPDALGFYLANASELSDEWAAWKAGR